MKKILIICFIILLSSCRIFSAMDSLIGAVEATGEYIIEELEE